mmetsp:Transcript_10195/g.27963  ORF Transcript_10195/g.27963 Transcript_10195/m.27963 type:complete len:250 (+) Transcript_10195:408-1157(+)
MNPASLDTSTGHSPIHLFTHLFTDLFTDHPFSAGMDSFNQTMSQELSEDLAGSSADGPSASDMLGWIAAVGGMLAFGTFGVPIKSKRARSVNIDPLVFQSYKTAMCFLTCWLVLPCGTSVLLCCSMLCTLLCGVMQRKTTLFFWTIFNFISRSLTAHTPSIADETVDDKPSPLRCCSLEFAPCLLHPSATHQRRGILLHAMGNCERTVLGSWRRCHGLCCQNIRVGHRHRRGILLHCPGQLHLGYLHLW